MSFALCKFSIHLSAVSAAGLSLLISSLAYHRILVIYHIRVLLSYRWTQNIQIVFLSQQQRNAESVETHFQDSVVQWGTLWSALKKYNLTWLTSPLVTARSRGTAMMIAWQKCSIIGHQEIQLPPKWTECIKQNHAGSRPSAQRGSAGWAISKIICLIFQFCVDMKLLFGTLWNYLLAFFLGIRIFCFFPLKKGSRLIQLTSHLCIFLQTVIFQESSTSHFHQRMHFSPLLSWQSRWEHKCYRAHVNKQSCFWSGRVSRCCCHGEALSPVSNDDGFVLLCQMCLTRCQHV